ncbi:MAG: hypothetical protein R3257_08075 [bacterium]|nr:hypothetical protein [bacterium]
MANLLISFFLVTVLIPNLFAAESASWSILRMDGIGPVKVGMTLSQAEKAAGMKMPAIQEEMNQCTFVAPKGKSQEMIFMVYKGKIVRADVPPGAFDQKPSPVKTPEGIGMGDSMAKVKKTYRGRITQQRHPYGQDGKDFYLLVKPLDPKDKDYLMIFELRSGKVTGFRAGLKGDVQAIEGCS